MERHVMTAPDLNLLITLDVLLREGSVARANAIKALGTGRGGKAKEEELKGASLAVYAGKRARKGKAVDAFQKVSRLQALQ